MYISRLFVTTLPLPKFPPSTPSSAALRSKPAVKSLPSAHRIATRISGSASISSKACLISVKNTGAIAFRRSGLSSTTSAIGPFRSTRITVYFVLIYAPSFPESSAAVRASARTSNFIPVDCNPLSPLASSKAPPDCILRPLAPTETRFRTARGPLGEDLPFEEGGRELRSVRARRSRRTASFSETALDALTYFKDVSHEGAEDEEHVKHEEWQNSRHALL